MLLGLVPKVGDLCEISPLNYKEVPCEIIDVNHDDFQYKILFNPINNKQEVYWLSSNRINWIARKYKLLDVTEIENDLKTKVALVVKATAYIMLYHETDTKVIRLESFTDNLKLADTFIFNANTSISQYILNNPEEQKIFNLTHFNKRDAQLKSGVTEALFHEDY